MCLSRGIVNALSGRHHVLPIGYSENDNLEDWYMSSIREIAKAQIMDAAETLCKDASYILAEKLDWHPMDLAKSVNEILAECAHVNYMLVTAVKGSKVDEPAEKLDFDALKDYVLCSAKAVCESIDSLDDAALCGDIQMPWGATMPMTAAIMLPASHMSYHDGQVNYIQVLLGDTKFHWAEG